MEHKKRWKKAQGATEFAIIFGAVLFFFVIFFTVIQQNISDKNQEKERLIAQNIALDVQGEINLAAGASDGYSRNFDLPQNILGKYYELNVTDGRLYMHMEDFSASYKIAAVTGDLRKGENTIRKQGGTVYVN